MYFSESQSDIPRRSGADDCMEGMTASSDTVLPLADGSCIEALSITPYEPKLLDSDAIIALPPPPAPVPGVIGLQNIGNTCFMNSVLQCLLHCKPLCDYFLSGQYKYELNTSNPLGTGGKLAKEFAKLVEDVWKDPSSQVVVPRDLKYVIGEHAPMFLGYQQQDSQELVTFLLDGLHEDLNLVKEKPYTECIEANGRSDAEVAGLSWEQHLRRNKSEIVDIFQGQFKSRLCCPKCNKSSVTFDPFMYLSLPIPNQPDLPLLITFTASSLPALPPLRFGIHVFRDATDLPRTIAAAVAAELPPEYSEDIVTNDILVYTQTGNSFQLMENFFFSNSRKKIFCSFAPGVSKSAFSPRISPKVSADGPPSPKRARNDTVHLCIQVRMGRKSLQQKKFEENTSVGAPTVISLSRTVDWAEFVSSIKRTIIYATGGRSKQFLEGMREVRICVENGSVFALNSATGPEMELLFSGEASPLNVFVDVPIDDSHCRQDDWGDEEAISWSDLEHSVSTKIGEYFRSEKSWKLMAVGDAPAASTPISLDDCFNLFSTEEVLGEGDEWFCANCSEHVCARKKIDLWKMPKTLIIHLKRFQYTRGGFRNKIEAVVDFAKCLDVAPHLAVKQEECKYNLFGVSNHSGSLYSGHYTAYAKLEHEWFNFNDSYVSKSASPTPDASSYLLFYQRCS